VVATLTLSLQGHMKVTLKVTYHANTFYGMLKIVSGAHFLLYATEW